MLRSVSRIVCWSLMVASLAVARSATAQEWKPSKVVRIVVPIVGSTNDVLGRLVGAELQKVLGQPVIVENKGGAGGMIGAAEVAKSAPDGHTLLVGFNGPLSINPSLYPKMSYDPQKNLAPITLAVRAPQFLVVNPNVPAKTLAEFVNLAKKKNLSYGSVSSGSASHLTMEMLNAAAHIQLTHVPYRGATQAVTDLLSGEVDAAFLVPGNIQQFAKAGRARILASTGEKRFASTPEVPTMIELGYEGFTATSWIGFLAPGGTPQPIIDRYNKEIVRILQQPEIRAKLIQLEFEVVASTPAEFAQWIRTDTQLWGKVIKSAGVKPE
jgi:tripartite-type tricarboxylate transporter receptor subunit TctC